MIPVTIIEIEQGEQVAEIDHQSVRLANVLSIDSRRSLGIFVDTLLTVTGGYLSYDGIFDPLSVALEGHSSYELFTSEPIPAPVKKITVLGILEVDVTGEVAQATAYRNVIPLTTIEIDVSGEVPQTISRSSIVISTIGAFEADAATPTVVRRKTRVSVVTVEV